MADSDDPNRPTWLTPEGTNGAAGAAAPHASASAAPTLNEGAASDTGASASAATNGAGDDDGAADAELPSIILIMRLANMGAAAALIACSVRFRSAERIKGDFTSRREGTLDV